MKQIIKFSHPVGCDAKKGNVAVGHADSLDQSVQRSFSILLDLIWRSPENDCKIPVGLSQVLVRPSDHPEDAGVGYYPKGGPISDICLVPESGSVVHTNHTLHTINLLSRPTRQDVAGAGHQRTVPTVQIQTLGERKYT